MKYRDLGKTGLKVSEIGFGAWALGGECWGGQPVETSLRALIQSFDMGCNFIDTAHSYGSGNSESIIGDFCGKNLVDGNIRHAGAVLSTKIKPASGRFPPSPYVPIEDAYPEAYIRDTVERSLRNLETNCIDVLHLHTWTRAWNRKPTALQTLYRLRDEGKIRAIGISTPDHDQNAVIDLIRGNLIDVVQVAYNIFEQEPAAELLPTAQEYGVGVIVRCPFDEGMLTGKYLHYAKWKAGDFRRQYFRGERYREATGRVKELYEVLENGEDIYLLPQLALKFCLAHPAVSTVIPGIRNAAQAQANLSVSDLPDLPPALLDTLKRHAWIRGSWYS